MSKRLWTVALLSLTFGTGLMLHTFFVSDAWRQRQSVRADLAAIRRDNDGLRDKVEDLRSRIDALRSRPEVQERVIRHDLGYARAGDLVVDLGNGS